MLKRGSGPPAMGAAGTDAVLATAMSLDRDAATAAPQERERFALSFEDPRHFVHCLLFLLEFSRTQSASGQKLTRPLQFFLTRAGGLHLFLMLLNARYNKPAAGRRPGWVFSGLKARVGVSERALRMLIRDGISEGLIELQPPTIDARMRSYRLTETAVDAWEALMTQMVASMSETLVQLSPGALANIDYSRWDPTNKASHQTWSEPPSRAHRSRG